MSVHVRYIVKYIYRDFLPLYRKSHNVQIEKKLFITKCFVSATWP